MLADLRLCCLHTKKFLAELGKKAKLLKYTRTVSKSYTMGCPPVCGDNPRALASGLSYVQVDNPWYNYFMPPTSVQTLHITRYFVLKLVRVV